MTLDEVRGIVQGGESPQVEFKRSTGQRSAAARSICGMLNGRGGHVLFGVTDDGDIVGQEVSDSTRQDIARELSQIEPQVVLDPEIVPVEGDRAVIVISVPGDRTGPYTYDGRPYVRQGPTTRQMEQETYEQRLMENRDPRRRWEARPASNIGVVDLDASEITRTISAAIDRGRMEEPGTRDPEDLLRGLGLMHDGQVLNAAVVLFGEDRLFMPDYPQCLLRMARFRGTTKSEFEDNRQVRGNAFKLFQQAQQFQEVQQLQQQIRQLAATLTEIIPQIPDDVDWILRVDGHTDQRPIDTERFPSNWELSTARAVEGVKTLIGEGIPARRLAATGFGANRPLAEGTSRADYRRNRRIEFKLTQP